ncbi:efflux RND transporter permease subunit [Oceanicoccus sp. KOV_DT_Chl]|uniref:efflux RND transporter permease subunit n=1 Tax=Oceanicoccus sp. KOV_DT_Chl TaxID=1904639 RepID=UPI000C7C9E74|nr:efflux RND transporter permease subunit [Oceanicoccus sp. KOV_DT_Chl]
MNGLIKTFVRNPVAPNLAMIIMILAGLWAANQLTRQLLPAFAVNLITITVQWPGAAAQDVETSLTQPIEDQLLALDEVKNISSVSRDNQSQITLEYPSEVDVNPALDKVKNAFALIRNLPADIEEPQITIASRNEGVLRLVLTGPVLDQLRPIVSQFERELRARGISRVTINGLPSEEIAIDIPSERLNELNVSLTELATRIKQTSADTPAGNVGAKDITRQLRSLDKQRTVAGFQQLPIEADKNGRLLTLGDIAEITRAPIESSSVIFSQGKPAIEFVIKRSEQEDAISVAENLLEWTNEAQASLPVNVELLVYDEIWKNVDRRINIMGENALSGLILLLLILYLFLNGSVAIWVAVGIPVSILAGLMALYLLGGTINIMTLFAMIMTLGIIVDDAIVVSEEAVTLYQQGASPMRAAEQAATKMFAPVLAASLTTIAAFLPLMTIGGATGSILFAIPLVVVCVVIASLIECFIVLPGHLNHSLSRYAKHQPSKIRNKIDLGFENFKKNTYRPMTQWCVDNRRTTLACGIAGLLFIFGLLGGGKIGFSFFPQPDGTTISADIRFTAGSPAERVSDYIAKAKDALFQAQEEIGEEIIVLVVAKQQQTGSGDTGSHVGELIVEVTDGDTRTTTNAELIRVWQRILKAEPGLEYFIIKSSRGGCPAQISTSN